MWEISQTTEVNKERRKNHPTTCRFCKSAYSHSRETTARVCSLRIVQTVAGLVKKNVLFSRHLGLIRVGSCSNHKNIAPECIKEVSVHFWCPHKCPNQPHQARKQTLVVILPKYTRRLTKPPKMNWPSLRLTTLIKNKHPSKRKQ